jgi:uncharacterized protein
MSKYLLILGAIFIGFWLWRSGRSQGADKKAAPKNQPTTPPMLQDMVCCAACAVHLPQADAVKGKTRGDWFCSQEHRKLGAR